MATRKSFQIVHEFAAGADLSTKQFRFMEWDGTDVDPCNAITDLSVGVLQNKPDAAGKHAEVLMIGGTKMVAGAAITAGALLGTDDEGRAVPIVAGTDTTQYILGRAMSAASGAGIIISAMVDCTAIARAA
jgi:hypothetical protein